MPMVFRFLKEYEDCRLWVCIIYLPFIIYRLSVLVKLVEEILKVKNIIRQLQQLGRVFICVLLRYLAATFYDDFKCKKPLHKRAIFVRALAATDVICLLKYTL